MKLYWWSPRKNFRDASVEIRSDAVTWLRLRMNGGKLLSNFGDEMSPLILRAFGYTVRWSPLVSAEVTAIGSLLDMYGWVRRPTESVVWGSGLRMVPTTQYRNAILGSVRRFAAVRGPRTRDALELPANTVLGDPGLLAPALVDRSKLRRGLHSVVIPHYRVWANAEQRAELKAVAAEGFQLVTPTQDPLEVVRAIASASVVYTSSLHGLIVADALGVPAALIRFSGPELSGEPLFKYVDYLESVGSSPRWFPVNTIADGKRAVLRDEIENESEARQEMAAVLRKGLEISVRSISGT